MSEPLNIKLGGPQFEPTGPEWAKASPEKRTAYWKFLGTIALRVKRSEILRGIGADGNPLQPVKPGSRKDKAGGKPLDPHRKTSRTYRLLAAKPHAKGVTLYWRGHGRVSWATILGYHAYQHGPRSLPVRNTLGISPAGRKKIAREGRVWWGRQKSKPTRKPKPKPEPGPTKVVIRETPRKPPRPPEPPRPNVPLTMPIAFEPAPRPEATQTPKRGLIRRAADAFANAGRAVKRAVRKLFGRRKKREK